ncbi:MAG: hypothetical protein NXI24_13140 [bacterium]|nr:hypothetical protein [bacterium]
MISPENIAIQLLWAGFGVLLGLICLGAALALPYFWLRRPRRASRYRVSQREAQFRPYERRLVLAARANNRRPGCVIALSLALLFGLTLSLSALVAGWEDFAWFGRIMTMAYGLVGIAVLVLMLINFFKNFGFRAYNGQEVQLDEAELLVDRSLIDSRIPGEDMFHPHLQRYLHKKFYYCIPLRDISAVTVSALVHSMSGQPQQFPFAYLNFTDFEAVYMLQTRFMGGSGEMRFLKHLEMIGQVPLYVDARFAEFYAYLKTAVQVKLE